MQEIQKRVSQANAKKPLPQRQEARERKRKAKLKGNKAGARNLLESQKTQQQNANKAKNDKRVGSKKAINLGSEPEVKTIPAKKMPQPKVTVIKKEATEEQPIKLSAEKELMLIENDQRLNDLLEQLDNNEEVSQADSLWVDQQMQRHQILMKQLGWLDDDGEEDLIQQFESASSALDEFK
ncbi:Der GTPase-activating protein YihI [Psychromonas sp. KJ10-10]|uniref:Der GTPase-activating protein YihI n=1 Tax=Psychromonas sp. KJ10-10 TaxID=3391823 RepID=UPI0039B59CEF